MSILREVLALIRDLPDRFGDWCDRTVMEAHRVEMVPADDPCLWPSGEMPWCFRCNVAWPCDESVTASDRLTQREAT